VPDYSEFPTTPTAWQETQWHEARVESARELAAQGDPRPPRRPDPVALIPGVIFTVIAIVLMTGLNLPGAVFRGGGVLWVLLIGGGVLLILGELRKTRRRG
jgi:hypothetical protein